MKFGLADFNRYFNDVATFPIIPPDITGDPAEYLVSSGLACIGTPEDCIAHFERLWKGSSGGLGGILLLAHNWADWAQTQRSYELMARYVHPHFQRNSNALRDFSYADAKGKHATAGMEMQQAVQAAIEKHAAGRMGATEARQGARREAIRNLTPSSSAARTCGRWRGWRISDGGVVWFDSLQSGSTPNGPEPVAPDAEPVEYGSQALRPTFLSQTESHRRIDLRKRLAPMNPLPLPCDSLPGRGRGDVAPPRFRHAGRILCVPGGSMSGKGADAALRTLFARRHRQLRRNHTSFSPIARRAATASARPRRAPHPPAAKPARARGRELLDLGRADLRRRHL